MHFPTPLQPVVTGSASYIILLVIYSMTYCMCDRRCWCIIFLFVCFVGTRATVRSRYRIFAETDPEGRILKDGKLLPPKTSETASGLFVVCIVVYLGREQGYGWEYTPHVFHWLV